MSRVLTDPLVVSAAGIVAYAACAYVGDRWGRHNAARRLDREMPGKAVETRSALDVAHIDDAATIDFHLELYELLESESGKVAPSPVGPVVAPAETPDPGAEPPERSPAATETEARPEELSQPPALGDQEGVDAELIHAHLSGDPDAFGVLYHRYYSRLVSMLSRRLNDPHAASDIAQETMIKAVERLDRFDTSRPLWPWLRTIATNLSADLVRSRVRLTYTGRLPDAADPQAESFIDEVAARERLVQALEALPERQKTALVLSYVEGMTTEQVAVTLGIGRTAVDQLLFRARRRLRYSYLAMQEHDSASNEP